MLELPPEYQIPQVSLILPGFYDEQDRRYPMAHVLVVIMHDLTRLPALLEGWRRIGVPGVTIVNSIGGEQVEGWLEKIGLKGFSRILEQSSSRQRTLISVISDENLLEQAIAEADEIVEGFDRPHSGILFTIPVAHTLGIRKRGHPAQPSEIAKPHETMAENRKTPHQKTPVADITNMWNLEPIVVQVDTSLQSIVSEAIRKPNVHVVCVVNEERRLVGLIDFKALADAFFSTIFPEKFFSELKDLEQVLDFVQYTKINLASDLMREPVWVKKADTLEKAFQLMHEHRLTGLPVVDDHYRITGYINLLEMMAICLPDIEAGEGSS